MQLIVRKEYLNELIELYGTPDIKVITGIRRSGKSVLLQGFVSYLQSLEEPVNIVMINLQELEFDHLLEYHALHKYILDQYKEGMTNVLLIDEVQLCPQFELAINSIYTKGIYDIYITGSNAFFKVLLILLGESKLPILSIINSDMLVNSDLFLILYFSTKSLIRMVEYTSLT